MPRIEIEHAGNSNRCAFLDVIAWSELKPGLLAVSDDGYNLIVGSTVHAPILFQSYATHPHKIVDADGPGPIPPSSAAGRYQFIYPTWAALLKLLCLPDFGPLSQDLAALELVRERHALPMIDRGDIPAAIDACRNIWASFPRAGYGQHENKLDDLLRAYWAAGGR